ncbi:MAG: Bro-N domain-containing protein [bacterium]|nr:Bro-N domain-containing protein [bacterium]
MEHQNNKIVLFQSRKVRRVWHQKEWYFSVIDIVTALTATPSPRQYWSVLKTREPQLLTICLQLKLESADKKFYLTDCVNTKNAFRLIQSIPSPKAEPFKMWLAQVGQERLEEIENPELAQERMKMLYEKKGYPKNWIDKRLRGIAIRQGLTDEWKERGIAKDRDYAILTAEISKATFGMTPSQYKKYKNIPAKTKLNLRDNMTDLELIFTMLGERVTTEISQTEKPIEMPKHMDVARRGGKVAGNARKETEKEINAPVISKQNFLGNGVKYIN